MIWTKTVPPEDSRWYWMLLTKAHNVPCAGKRFPVQVKHRNGGVAWLRDMSGWLAPAPYYLTERGAFFSDESIPEPVPEPGEEDAKAEVERLKRENFTLKLLRDDLKPFMRGSLMTEMGRLIQTQQIVDSWNRAMAIDETQGGRRERQDG